jgi:hypothetical protein
LQILIPTGNVGAVVSLVFSRLYFLVTRRILLGDAAAVRASKQRGVFRTAAPSIVVASFPALVTVWATHLSLWGVVDPVMTWVFRLIPGLLLFYVAHSIIERFEIAAGVALYTWSSWGSLLSGTWSLWDTLTSVTRLVYVLGLSLVAPSGPLHFLVLHGSVLRGVLAGIVMQAAPVLTVLKVLIAPLLFVAWPVTASLGVLATCVKGLFWGLVWFAWSFVWRFGINVCLYLVMYVLPLPVVQDFSTWICKVAAAVPDAPSSSAATEESWLAVACEMLPPAYHTKMFTRQYSTNSWWFDAILLLWFCFVMEKIESCAKRTARRSRGESAQETGAAPAKEGRVETGRQRKEGKTLQRKQQKQRVR